MYLHELDELIKAVAPIDGINSNGVIHFKGHATSSEKKAAQKIMDENLSKLVSNAGI